jgi:hypothetical protein
MRVIIENVMHVMPTPLKSSRGSDKSLQNSLGTDKESSSLCISSVCISISSMCVFVCLCVESQKGSCPP